MKKSVGCAIFYIGSFFLLTSIGVKSEDVRSAFILNGAFIVIAGLSLRFERKPAAKEVRKKFANALAEFEEAKEELEELNGRNASDRGGHRS